MKDGTYNYEFEFKAKTDNMYTITPLSDILLFNPPSLKVIGVNDCHNDIASFIGDLGKVKNYQLHCTTKFYLVLLNHDIYSDNRRRDRATFRRRDCTNLRQG